MEMAGLPVQQVSTMERNPEIEQTAVAAAASTNGYASVHCLIASAEEVFDLQLPHLLQLADHRVISI